ncbi:ABC transporter substrate-binding protein [Roseibium sp. RKSG952]|uniref:ABC transporter substrate-binding protein n=1 Tax=Roseibium sp. RKSG952 TaxID=2529384 RepID=UPI0012BCAC94|nr:ABC transporter substrate-binding protein [Roseibium sp. RKSG952]MTH97021.1 ABC transporter substrate-binding protein [Roseibium sp. RKSG952]
MANPQTAAALAGFALVLRQNLQVGASRKIKAPRLRTLLSGLITGLCLGLVVPNANAETEARPERVVSINLCTDQLAMLLADPDQLRAVSRLAADPSLSLMSGEADSLAVHSGSAEEIFRLKPDLVLAGTFTSRPTVNLLRRLGVRVEEFEPVRSFNDIAGHTRKLGAMLHREQKAEQLIKALKRDIETTNAAAGSQPQALLGSYGSNSYTTGAGTLENEIVRKAGYRHLGEELGLSGVSQLALETLILSRPDYLLVWDRYANAKTRATEILFHPALDARIGKDRRILADNRYWICGTPLTAQGVSSLAASVRAKETDARRTDAQKDGE